MARDMMPGDDFDGVQYDDFYAPSAAQLEAEEIRRECSRLCSRLDPRDCGANRVVTGHVFRLDWYSGARCWCHNRPLAELA